MADSSQIFLNKLTLFIVFHYMIICMRGAYITSSYIKFKLTWYNIGRISVWLDYLALNLFDETFMFMTLLQYFNNLFPFITHDKERKRRINFGILSVYL